MLHERHSDCQPHQRAQNPQQILELVYIQLYRLSGLRGLCGTLCRWELYILWKKFGGIIQDSRIRMTDLSIGVKNRAFLYILIINRTIHAVIIVAMKQVCESFQLDITSVIFNHYYWRVLLLYLNFTKKNQGIYVLELLSDWRL